jgi:hypothetical protein
MVTPVGQSNRIRTRKGFGHSPPLRVWESMSEMSELCGGCPSACPKNPQVIDIGLSDILARCPSDLSEMSERMSERVPENVRVSDTNKLYCNQNQRPSYVF